MTTTTKGWAVVGPEGVCIDSVREFRLYAKAWAERCGLRNWITGDLPDGYRLARVTITVDDGGSGDGE